MRGGFTIFSCWVTASGMSSKTKVFPRLLERLHLGRSFVKGNGLFLARAIGAQMSGFVKAKASSLSVEQ